MSELTDNIELTNNLLEQYSRYYDEKIIDAIKTINLEVSQKLLMTLNTGFNITILKKFCISNDIKIKRINTQRIENDTFDVIQICIKDKTVETHILSIFNFLSKKVKELS